VIRHSGATDLTAAAMLRRRRAKARNAVTPPDFLKSACR
jgi:hypothetical protein